MIKFVRYACLIALLFSAKSTFSQVEVLEDLIPDTELHISKQHSYFGQIHGNGFGFGYRFGRILSIEKYNFQEFEFLQIKHPKAERRPGRNIVGSNRRYIYGGINQLFALRYGFGTQRTLNEKPYWGGIQVDYTVSAGGVLGLAIPQYLNIIYEKNPRPPIHENPYRVQAEKYSPDSLFHNDWGYINGMGPMFKGLFNLRPYPGIYAKFGFNFDFGKYQERVSAIEAGVMIDVFPIPVPMMAIESTENTSTGLKADKNFFFLNFYVAYHFGKRK
jgi:hypothetical protein